MAMPPAVLAKILLLANPEFVMAGSADARATLLGYATDTQSYSGLIQYLQTNPKVGYVVIDIETEGEEATQTLKHSLDEVPGTLRTRVIY